MAAWLEQEGVPTVRSMSGTVGDPALDTDTVDVGQVLSA